MNRYQLYYQNNKEREKERKRLYYQRNKKRVLMSCKKWQDKNKNSISIYNADRYSKKKEHILETCRKYRIVNEAEVRNRYLKRYGSIKYRNYHKQYTKNKYHTDPIYKIMSLHRTRLRYALKSQSAKKLVNHSVELFGCNPSELKFHIENQLKPEWTWETHGILWHIDHIKPLSKFDLTNEIEQKKAFHYTNLQPLSKEDNLRKHNYFQED